MMLACWGVAVDPGGRRATPEGASEADAEADAALEEDFPFLDLAEAEDLEGAPWSAWDGQRKVPADLAVDL